MNNSELNYQIKLRSFESQILYFNGLYKLHIAKKPSLEVLASQPSRMEDFKKIVIEEANEIDEIPRNGDELETLTAVADLLGDIVVYCHSEAAKYGIPLNEVLSIIMQSNFSKLDAQGNPIYDERGKVMKGPHYWRPEPMIKKLLEERINET